MPLYFTSLNSGSNGNSYYVGNGKEAVLIDAGVSCRTIERRLKKLELDIDSIKGIFISHEHTDHIKGVEVLSGKYDIPVYITPKTLQNSRLKIRKDLISCFEDATAIQIGNLGVHPFSKPHDAADPYSFCITEGELCVGVFTDIGAVTESLKQWFSRCNAAFLEANYDEEMLATGPYPFYLKERITSALGHLSNDNAFELFSRHRSPNLSHLILSHLSAQNNSPEIVERMFRNNQNSVEIVVASRRQETPLYRIVPAGASAEIVQEKVTYRQLYFDI